MSNAGAAAVKPEGKLLEVEAFDANQSLVGAEDPSLETNPRQHLSGGPIELRDERDDVLIAGFAELGIRGQQTKRNFYAR